VGEGYTTPTPIQAEVIPHALAGRDLLACAPTGTGKTAAFVLPLLEALGSSPRNGRIRALVVTPTRELAAQIAERVSVYGRHQDARYAVVYGGVRQRGQELALRRSPDVLIATPGRLLDLMQQGFVRLDGVTHLVLDEADRMLDMGFVHDVRRICAAIPAGRQTLLFSATIPNDILALASGMLADPVRVTVAPDVTTAEKVAQSVMFVARREKRAVLERMLRTAGVERALVFTRTKRGANQLSDHLERSGIESAAIHGNKSQGARERALEHFRRGDIRVLVATDVAARGIDVDGVSHVFNFDLPNVAESYVHRIGRTGRAGAAGSAVSLCDPLDERTLLRDIERLIRQRLPVVGEDGRAVEGAALCEPATRTLSPGEGRGARRWRGARRGVPPRGGRLTARSPPTTPTEAAAATAAAAALALLGLVDPQRAPVEGRAVHACDRRLRRGVGSHRHEAKAARLAGLSIGHEVHVGDLAVLRERLAERVAARVEREIAHIESIAHTLSVSFRRRVVNHSDGANRGHRAGYRLPVERGKVAREALLVPRRAHRPERLGPRGAPLGHDDRVRGAARGGFDAPIDRRSVLSGPPGDPQGQRSGLAAQVVHHRVARAKLLRDAHGIVVGFRLHCVRAFLSRTHTPSGGAREHPNESRQARETGEWRRFSAYEGGQQASGLARRGRTGGGRNRDMVCDSLPSSWP
jgi:ATP-dependent RNA helicase RhlE